MRISSSAMLKFGALALLVAVAGGLAFSPAPTVTQAQNAGATQSDSLGASLYQERCAVCHDNPQDRTPPLSIIKRYAAEDVMQALTTGSMRQQGAGLNAIQLRALAVHVTGKQPDATMEKFYQNNMCQAPAKPLSLVTKAQWNGWARDLDSTRYQPNPGFTAADVPKLKVKWAWAHPGAMATGQPTLIGDRLFVTTEAGVIYSLNAQTGCTYWTTRAGSPVRAAMTVGALPAPVAQKLKAKYALYFGDERAFVHAVNAETGAPLWKLRIDEHVVGRVTGAPVLNGNRLYVPVSSIEEAIGRNEKYECCTFRGAIAALDAYTGKLLWKSFSVQDEPKPYKKNAAGTQMYGPAGGAIWTAPTLDLKRGVIYGPTGNSYTDAESLHTDAIIAFDLVTGKVKWANQATPKDNFIMNCGKPGQANCPNAPGPDYDFGSSVIVRKLANGKTLLLAGQKSGTLYALDPDQNGKLVWQANIGAGSALGGIEWGITADAEFVYVPMADVFGAKRKPGLAALRIADGQQVWFTPAPPAKCSWGATRCNNSQSAAASSMPGVVFSGATDGHLRAYATKDGAIIWDFDTAAETYQAVNGKPARGGALDQGGPVLGGGMLFTNSGYGRIVGQPGNLLLAFSVDGK